MPDLTHLAAGAAGILATLLVVLGWWARGKLSRRAPPEPIPPPNEPIGLGFEETDPLPPPPPPELPTPDTARPTSPLETYHESTRPDPRTHTRDAVRHALESTDDILDATERRRNHLARGEE